LELELFGIVLTCNAKKTEKHGQTPNLGKSAPRQMRPQTKFI